MTHTHDPTITLPPGLVGWSAAARQALLAPTQRGSFRPLDAARRQLALLSVADSLGQARLYWLIDLQTQKVADARFLAYGTLSSHPLAQALCAYALNRSLDDVCQRDAELFESDLRDSPETPAFDRNANYDSSFLKELQVLALAALPSLRVLPKPVEVQRYVRKREQEWDEHDRAWLPLSLMKKIMRVQKEGDRCLQTRTGRDITWSVEGLHEDFTVRVRFEAVADEERPLLVRFLSAGLKDALHPHLNVEEVET